MKIIAITAIWCPSCLIMKNVWNRILKTHTSIELEEHDYDQDEAFCKSLSIGTKLPVYLFYQDGKEVERLIGEKKEKEILTHLERYGA